MRSSTGPSESEVIAEIATAVRNADLTQFDAWSDLDMLSSRTQIDAIEVDPAGINVSGNTFSGVANVYVVLEYGGGQGKDGFTTSDAFLGKFKGHFEEALPKLDRFTVDTSPFYAGEETTAQN